jgi:hypothetical protein
MTQSLTGERLGPCQSALSPFHSPGCALEGKIRIDARDATSGRLETQVGRALPQSADRGATQHVRGSGAIRRIWAQTVSIGSGGVISTNSTVVVPFPNLPRRLTEVAELPTHCGNGHPLTPDNVRIDQGEGRWRCRQCGRERAAAFRARQKTAA